MTKEREALRMALEALHGFIPYLPLKDEAQCGRYDQAITAIKEALANHIPDATKKVAQPEQEPNKDGSPCPKFWDWLPKAYNFEGDGNFTKYNMEVAFLAGKQAAQPREPEQEPVAMKFKIYKPIAPDPVRQGINNALLPWVYDQDRSSGFDASMWVTPVATLPPQRTEQEQQIETLKRCLFQMQEAAKDLVEQAKSLNPPQRTWVGLTDEDKQIAFDDTQEGGGFWEFADAIEAKLKEKNT